MLLLLSFIGKGVLNQINKIFKNEWLSLLILLLITPLLSAYYGGCAGGAGSLHMPLPLDGIIGPSGGGSPSFIWGHAYLPDSDDYGGINISLEGTSYSSITDVNGYFYISGFPNGSYNLVASKSGYRNVTSGPWVFSPTHHGNVDLKLKSVF